MNRPLRPIKLVMSGNIFNSRNTEKYLTKSEIDVPIFLTDSGKSSPSSGNGIDPKPDPKVNA